MRNVVPQDFIAPLQDKLHRIRGTFGAVIDPIPASERDLLLGELLGSLLPAMLRALESHEEWRHRALSLRQDVAGSVAPCRGCGADIKFIKHANGKTAPYTREALNHFVDCVEAKAFRGRA